MREREAVTSEMAWMEADVRVDDWAVACAVAVGIGSGRNTLTRSLARSQPYPRAGTVLAGSREASGGPP